MDVQTEHAWRCIELANSSPWVGFLQNRAQSQLLEVHTAPCFVPALSPSLSPDRGAPAHPSGKGLSQELPWRATMAAMDR